MNPSAALNDWTRTIRGTNQSVKCLTNHFGEPSIRTGKRATNEDLTLYLTIEGVEASNEFSVNSSFGNVTYGKYIYGMVKHSIKIIIMVYIISLHNYR